MEIKIKTTKEDFFKNWLLYLNPVLKLTDSERNVLALYLFVVCLNSKADKVKVSKKVFSAPVRKMIRGKLNMSEPSFNNCFSSLRKKGFIVKRDYGFDIVDKLKLDLNNNNYLKINFELK